MSSEGNTPGDRLRYFRSFYLKMSQKEFNEKLGNPVTQTTVMNYELNRTPMKQKFLDALKKEFPSLRVYEWLLNGVGEMFSQNLSVAIEPESKYDKDVLREMIKDKDTIIALYRAQIEDLKRQLDECRKVN